MLWSILAGLLLALLSPWLARLSPRRLGWLLCLLPLGLTCFFLSRLGAITGGKVVTEAWDWVPGLGVRLSFYLDGLSLLFALLICGVGTLIIIYAAGYLEDEPRLGAFYLWLLLFMSGMLGLVLAGNLITLFLFWELTGITSFFLIGFEDRRETSRMAALQALLVTGLGALAMLAGFVLLGLAADSFELSVLLSAGALVRGHALYLPMLLLILVGAFTKSAQFPFHFWLPSAMAAPTPVSAYLHSVTMVKAGVYLLFRLSPVLGGTDPWQTLLPWVGGTTMLLGAWLAMVQTDLKRILAYSTVSSLGTMVLLIGLDVPLAITAALVYLLAHALYKGALFMVAGAVSHAAGSRDLTRLGGLFRRMPLLGAAAVASALSMAGAPPLFGFIAKEHVYEALLMTPGASPAGGVAVVLASLMLVTVAAVLAFRPFFGRPAADLGDPHGISFSLLLGPVILAGFGLVLGIFPGLVDGPLLIPAAGAVSGAAAPFELQLWHGFNWILLASVATLAVGVALTRWHHPLGLAARRWSFPANWGPARGYEVGLAALVSLAGWQTRVLQNGRLRLYLLTIVGVTVVIVGGVLVTRAGLRLPSGVQPVYLRDLVLAGVILVAAWVVLRTGKRLAAVVAMGVIGYGVSLIYVMFGAPDLAMTQFIIETMTVVLFSLIVHRFPMFSRLRGKRTWALDATVALAAGGLMSVLALVALTEQHGSRLSGFFAERSFTEGHGRNIVNVILVDFRALDTLGEITVLSLAGAGVLALLKLAYRDKEGA